MSRKLQHLRMCMLLEDNGYYIDVGGNLLNRNLKMLATEIVNLILNLRFRKNTYTTYKFILKTVFY